ncbi:MAG: peptidase [Fluviicola sp.]|nr:MAG: peptidase [Fluviicola sp.]
MKKSICFIIALALFSCKENTGKTEVKKQEPVSNTSKIDSLLKKYEQNGGFMGSLAISHKGKIVYTNAIGFSDIETKKKSTIDTRYRIGSISKTFTATLIFKAIEEDKLALNQTIETYFPNVKNAKKITIAHLLQHRSGIHNFTRDKSFSEFRTHYKSPTAMLTMISGYDSDFEPGSTGDYSNSNYFLLSLILEKTFDATYEHILEEKLIKPLGLKNTYSGKETDVNKNECYSYVFADKWTKFPETDMSITIGSGSIVSTPKDLNRFMEALFTGKILSTESVTLMKSIKDNHGWGIFRYKIHDREGYGHGGHLDGFRSSSIYFPEEELSFTLTTNASKTDVNTIYSEILDLYFSDAVKEISESEVEKFAGAYISEEDRKEEMVFVKDKATLIHVISDEFKELLVYKGDNRFVMNQMHGGSISFTFSPDGKELTLEQGDYTGVYRKE